jgi:hypothetical protein
MEFGNSRKLNENDLVSTVQKVEPTIQIVCDGLIQTVPYSLRYLDMKLAEWHTLCENINREISSSRCRVVPIHPDGQSFNDNLVRGLAVMSEIGA